MNFEQYEIAVFVGTTPGHRLQNSLIQVMEVGPFEAGHIVDDYELNAPCDYMVMTPGREFAFCKEAALRKLTETEIKAIQGGEAS